MDSADNLAKEGKKETSGRSGSKFENVPRHVAFIMDGNGRWAEDHGKLERIVGHEKGAGNIHSIVETAEDLGVEFVTFFTFSTENWSRPEMEIDFILSDLLVRYLEIELPFMMEKNYRFNAIGNLGALPEQTRETLKKVKEATAENSGVKVTLALNYGGRQEILDAVKKLASEGAKDPGAIDGLDLDGFKNYLYDPELPDPDILIRTGGEKRISNFLLWQLSYTELYMMDVFWPEFGPGHLEEAVEDFNKRQRRFGGL